MKESYSFLETIRKDAEKQLAQMNRMIAPVLHNMRFDEVQRSLSAFNESMRLAHEPLIRLQKQVSQMAEGHQRWVERSQEFMIPGPSQPVRYVPEHSTANVPIEFTDLDVDMFVDTVVAKLEERGMTLHTHTTSAQIDLTYTRVTRTLTRAGEIKRTTRFDRSENNKRRDLFEKLMRTKRSLSTDELTAYLQCPNTDATYKVIQGLNRKMSQELNLTMNLIDGSDKGGYRIDKRIAIHEI